MAEEIANECLKFLCVDSLSLVEVDRSKSCSCGEQPRILAFIIGEEYRQGVLRDVGQVGCFSNIAADAGSQHPWLLLAPRPFRMRSSL